MASVVSRSMGYLGQPLNGAQWRFLALQTVLVILATLAVLLRLGARAVAKVRLWYDDFTIIVGLLFCYAMLAHGIISCKYGLGVSRAYAQLGVYFKESLIFFLVYVAAVTTIKCSILLMYYRIFKVQPFKKAVYMVGFVVGVWFFVTFFMVLFECTPVPYFWERVIDPRARGHCMNSLALFEATAAVNSALDIAILCLPVKMVWGLQMSVGKRVQLTITFLLGAFVCVVSIVRLVAVITQPVENADPTQDQMGDVVWTTTEIYVGVISACLPTLRPLLTKGNSIFSRFASKLSTSRSPSQTSPSLTKQRFWLGPDKSLREGSSGVSPPRSFDEQPEQGSWSQPVVSQWQSPHSKLATEIQGSRMSADLESGLPPRCIRVENKFESSWARRQGTSC